MKTSRTTRRLRTEAGIALLISIFVLLLICVVAIALIVSSGTETALAGNYRSSTGVYYSAYAGLEEARSRLSPNASNTFKSVWLSTFYSGSPAPIGKVGYVLNPGPGETAAAILTTLYPDNEYTQEFSSGPSTTMTTLSIWHLGSLSTLSFPGPQYKWVRINAVSEKSTGIDADGDGLADDTTHPLFYNGTQFTMTTTGAFQVFEITSLAVSPNASGQNSQKLVQYLVAPAPLNVPIPAALTLSDSPGHSATFQAPTNNGYFVIKGDDYDCSTNPANPTGNKYPAVGVFIGTSTTADVTTVKSGIPSIAYVPAPPPGSTVPQNYTGLGSAPDVENISSSFPSNLQTPSQLDALAQSIIQNADVVITPTPSGSPPYLGTATGSDLTSYAGGMSSSNPLTVVVQGNLDISNWSHDGYGLLVVTGTFTYDPDTNWYGIIAVIGQGIVRGYHQQYKQINGAMLVAKTRNGNNVLLTGSNFGGADVQFDDNMQGDGIRYSNCWIQKVQPQGGYKVLSFHEIAQ